MGEKDFQSEVLQRLTRIETNQDNMACHDAKIDRLEIQVAKVEAATKSAHYRLDAMQSDKKELKEDLTEAIKEQIGGIYKTAMILAGLVNFFAGIIMWLIKN